ncbi:unnamed protein product [Menidia menidia]|uniref:(Atlantic silverside) hypothetical protein n=1 Tax=Menidia menidia TaxID=238744 RepID=A0A8S4BKC5_9TELE|nr:unnamed protein product [Menidia menidia]
MILCLQSVLACRKPFPHTLQTKGRAPVCTGMCRSRFDPYLPTHFTGEVLVLALGGAGFAGFSPGLLGLALVVFHYLVQLAGQVLLVRVLGGGQLVRAQAGQLGVVQQQEPVRGRQRALAVRAGQPVSGQQLGLLVGRVQVVQVVERAAAGHGHGLVQDLRPHQPAPGARGGLLQPGARGGLLSAAQPAAAFAGGGRGAAHSPPQTGPPQLRVVHEGLGLQVVAEGGQRDHAGDGGAEAQQPLPVRPLLRAPAGLRAPGHDPVYGEGQALGDGGRAAHAAGHHRLQRGGGLHGGGLCLDVQRNRTLKEELQFWPSGPPAPPPSSELQQKTPARHFNTHLAVTVSRICIQMTNPLSQKHPGVMD